MPLFNFYFFWLTHAFNWNYNYGEAGKDLKVDLLNHPEYIEQNATLAFQVAIWRWMMPIKKHQPSAHDVFLGTWTPTKNDTLPLTCSMEILFVVMVIMSPWTTLSPITYITLILWVLVEKKLGLKKCLVVLSKLLSIHLSPHLLELCLVLMDSLFFVELIIFLRRCIYN